MVKNIEYHCWRISSEVNSLYQIHTQQLAFCLPFVRLIQVLVFFWALNTAFFFYFIQSIQRLTYYLLVVVQSCQYKWRILTGKISIECTYYSNLSKCLECMCGNIQKKSLSTSNRSKTFPLLWAQCTHVQIYTIPILGRQVDIEHRKSNNSVQIVQ